MVGPNTEGEKKSKLIGCEVAIDPKKTGMYLDPINRFTLGFGGDTEGGIDSIVVTGEMDTTHIEKAIKVGILRVRKDGKDISEKFGGKKLDALFGKQGIVEKGAEVVSKADAPYLQILAHNDQRKIIQDIRSFTNYAQLERLKELESMGKNPSSQCRVNVLDAIIDMMKKTPGIGDVRQMKQDKPDIIKMK